MTDIPVRLTLEDGIATITLDRAGKLNALTAAMITELGRVADALDADASVRCAILTGAGEKAFCAGGDITDWGGLSALDMGQTWVRQGFRTFDRLARLKVPLIAVLNGHVLGGGMELAGVADLRIAEAHASFAMPETALGMAPGWSGTQRLVRRFGASTIRRMVLFGERFDAATAERLGLCDRVVAKGEGLATARVLANGVAQRGPIAVGIAKQLINAAEGEEREAPYEILAGAFLTTTDDLKEGVASFREKRAPRFANR
jgi:enoyl-CoA hydratase/carnithine racemase